MRTEEWDRFVCSLREGRAHPFDGYSPVPMRQPRCDFTVEVSGVARYSCDGSNMFIHRNRKPENESAQVHRVTEQSAPWIPTARNAPVQTPLGWSVILGQPLLWITENLMVPGHIAAYVLWRYRKSGLTWRTTDPGRKDATAPIAAWSGDEGLHPAAYLMPFNARAHPRWSQLQATPRRPS